MTLRTRFMVYVIALLIGLVVLVLFVIEKREVRAIFDAQKGRGVLTAEYIAQLNLENLLFWDEEGFEEDLEKRIDQNLIYVIFYDRQGKPFVANDFIKSYKDIYSTSNLAAEAKKGEYFFERKRIVVDEKPGKDLSVLEIEVPIYVEGSPTKWASIKIGLSMEEVRAEEQQTHLMLILIGSSGLLIGVAGAILLARRITRPLQKLVEGTVKISKGDFTQEIEINTQDEIGNLAQSFNEMSHQLFLTRERMETASKRLIQAEKLASIGRISAGIAHEIRNPLTSVKLNIQKVMESQNLDEVDKEHLDITQEGIGHIENFIKELLNFARVSELHVDHFLVEEIIDESIKMIRSSLKLRKVHLEKEVQKDLPHVLVDGDKLRQVFLNILHNACEAVEEGGKIKISLSQTEKTEDRNVKIEISDNGTGIPDKDWENIFEPFYTTKSTGIGLGLANARKIIEQHKGSIRVMKKRGKGACFQILIPCREEK
ncbi:MAG: ATP-binding protein [Candidatus Aminicenantes bacterium]|nr:ATP-binding protein [Candidatus Aminicenantes bacterium]MDH5744391.1 ATP-binding protein [Candidatus Aminicenantes bacterium]